MVAGKKMVSTPAVLPTGWNWDIMRNEHLFQTGRTYGTFNISLTATPGLKPRVATLFTPMAFNSCPIIWYSNYPENHPAFCDKKAFLHLL
jgi:hypothetical protein